jgi:5-methylthioadenosine/S-adenosylhomocysteine deaminase
VAELDLLVRGNLVWPGPGRAELHQAAVAIQDGRVAWLGSQAEVPGRAKAVIGGPGRLIMPGLVNGHTHLAMTLFRGLADDLPLMDWLQNHIWPAEAALVSEDMTHWAGLLGCAEAIRSGTTCLAEIGRAHV